MRASSLLLLLASCATGPGIVGLRVVEAPSGVQLEWEPRPGARYLVLRALTSKSLGMLLTPQPLESPRFVDPTAVAGTPVFYRVRALDGEGSDLGVSDVLPVRPGGVDTTPPDRPAITSVARKVRNPSPVTEGRAEPLSWIEVYAGRNRLGEVQAWADGTFRFQSPNMILQDGLHRIRVRSRDAAGNVSADSAAIEVEVDTTPPAPPRNVRVTPYDDRIVVEWDPSLSPDIVGYMVYRREMGQTWVCITGDTLLTECKYVDETIRKGGVYAYRVTPLDDATPE